MAATYVVINHVRGHFFVGGKVLLAGHPSLTDYLTIAMLQATSLGTEMVILFFVLSGFAMAHSVEMSKSIGRFYAKRVVRIWPPYIAAVALAAGVGFLTGVVINPLPMLFYIGAAGPLTPQFWSLPYEVVFYALCPLLAVRPRPFLAVASAFYLSTIVLRGPLLNPWPSFALNFLGNEALFFACGITAYHYFDRIPVLTGKALAIVCAVAAGLAWVGERALGGANAFSNVIVIVASVLAIRNLPDHIPGWANFGFFSYSIYIFHFALMMLAVWALSQWRIDVRHSTNPLMWLLAVPPVLAGCFALYLVTERISNGWVRMIRARK